jgi:hypothetical protein
MGEKRNACRILVGKSEGKNLSGDRDIDGWIILKWIFREIEWSGMDWIALAQDRDQWRALVDTVMSRRVP